MVRQQNNSQIASTIKRILLYSHTQNLVASTAANNRRARAHPAFRLYGP